MAIQSAPGRFALLLGSGISYPAGIPTGWAVVSDLVGQIAVAEGEDEVPADPVAWYSERFGGAPDYSGLLEALAPTPAQRRDLLAGYFEPAEDEREQGRKLPTSAHRAVAGLVRDGYATVIVTTNFDRLLEQALQAEGIEPVVIATAAAAEGTIPLAHTRCTIIKVHGDYLDPNVRNTVGELDTYEPALDRLLDRAFDDYGLVVCGWSATWDPALRHAIERCPSRRYGTYWAAHGAPTAEAERVIAARGATTIPIDGANEFFDRLVPKIAALEELGKRSGIDVDIVTAEAKRYLPDPVHRIRLHDLAMDAAERALVTIDFDGNPTAGDVPAYLDMAAKIEATSTDVCAVLGVLGQFGDRADHHELLRRLLSRLATPTEARLGGLTAWINLRGYPALLGLFTAGCSASAGENWAALASALTVRVYDPHFSDGREVPLLSVINPYSTLEGGAINSLYGSKRKTPVSDYLHERVRSNLRPVMRVSDEQFDRDFDEWEYLLGVVGHAEGRAGYLGRYVWKHGMSFNGRVPDRKLLESMPVLIEYGLFEGSEERFEEARSEFNAEVERSSLRF